MKRLPAMVLGLLFAGLTLFGCAQMSEMMPGGGGWTTLIDGDKGMENFNRLGDANWRAEGGAIVADKATGSSFLVTKSSYRDFQIRAEFWAETGTNSGIFMRAQDRAKIGADNSYEVNIYDLRPGQEYSTAAIVDFAKVPVPAIYKAGGKWNTFDITVKGTNLVVYFNGVKTVDVNDSKFAQGPFGLQFANHGKVPGAVIKWRKVQVRNL